MTVEIGSMDELPCYSERIDGLLENDDDITGEVEFDNNDASYTDRIDGLLENEDDITDEVELDDNNANTSDSVPDASDDSITADSPNHRDKFSEPFGWNKEPGARESPGHSFTPQKQSEQFGSISSPEGKSLETTKSGVTGDTDFISLTKTSNAETSKPDSEDMGAGDIRGAFFVPHQADIIDLSTPSPSCRNVIDRKKRRISSSVSSEFIDLTKSPNFIQLS
jgi:structure-specific endonuclease subunit SLX1